MVSKRITLFDPDANSNASFFVTNCRDLRVPVRRANILCSVRPRSTAYHAFFAETRTLWIDRKWVVGVIRSGKPIFTPFLDVAVHIVESPLIWLTLPNRPRTSKKIVLYCLF